ncbi:hypothetical protein BH20ACT1_BH20ACT1_12480 [soil metagenome]
MPIANRVLATVLALALLVSGAVMAVEILLASVDRGPWLAPYDTWWEWATTTPWSHGDARLLFAVLAGIGLGLVVVELRRHRPVSLPMVPAASGVVAELDRRGVERWLADRAARVEGVSRAEAEVGTRAVHVRAASVASDSGGVEQRTRETVTRPLAELALARPLRVKVEVQSRRVS